MKKPVVCFCHGMIAQMKPDNATDHPPDRVEGVLETDPVYLKAVSPHYGGELFRKVFPDMPAGRRVVFIGQQIIYMLAENRGHGYGDPAVFLQHPGQLPAGQVIIPHMLHDLGADDPVKGFVLEGQVEGIAGMDEIARYPGS